MNNKIKNITFALLATASIASLTAGTVSFVQFAKTDFTGLQGQEVITPEKTQQESPQVTQAQEVTTNSIIMPIISGAEYSLDEETWQESNIFSGLTPGQTYTVYVRMAETEKLLASDSVNIEITLDKLTQEAPQVTQAEIVTADTITMPVIAGAEYSINNGVDWQTENIFSELEPKTEYTIYVRLAETATQYASAITQLVITTDSTAGLYDTDTGQRTMSWQELIDNEVLSINDKTVTGGTNKSLLSGNLILENDLNTIGYNAFYGCENLNTVIIPNSIQEIADSAFYNSGITSIIIPESVMTTGYNTFNNCKKLSEVTINSVTLPRFPNCTSLKTVNLADNVQNISSSNFGDCDLENFNLNINESNPYFTMENNVLYNKDKTQLIWYLDTTNTSFTVPESVLSIAEYAFRKSPNLSVLNIPNNTIEIGSNAFYSCEDLSAITINTPSLPLLSSCTNLKTINLGDNVQNISASNFLNCNLENFNLNINESNPYFTMENNVLYNKDKTQLIWYFDTTNTSFTIPESVLSIAEYAFYEHSNLIELNLPKNLTSIGNSALKSCSGLTSLTLPENLTSIETSALEFCTGLTSLTLPENLKRIGLNAFRGLYNLSELNYNVVNLEYNVGGIIDHSGRDSGGLAINIGENVLNIPAGIFGFNNIRLCFVNAVNFAENSKCTTIGFGAFRNIRLTSFTIPASVTTISLGAFYSKVETFRFLSTTPATFTNGDPNFLKYAKTIEVPMESLEAYKTAEIWSDYADKIVGYE